MKQKLSLSLLFIFIIFSVITYGQGPTAGAQVLSTISVKTISGEVVDVKVPNYIRPGDHISGSVIPKFQSATLEGAVIEIDSKQTNLKNKLFKFLVPAGIASIPFILRDSKGAEIARANIPVTVPSMPTPANNLVVPLDQVKLPPTPSPGNFAPINYCQPGQPLTINGNFDGDMRNTTVRIGDIPAEVLAESPRGSFVQVPENIKAGNTNITISEGGVTETLHIQVIDLNLSASKTLLKRGEKTTVTVRVSGLENLDLNNNNFKLVLTNMTPNIISMRNSKDYMSDVDINSANTKNGVYTTTTEVTGITTGSYMVGANVSSTTGISCWDEYKNCVAKCDADEKQCYKDCDKSNGGVGCYLACSAAARLCEAECFAEYLACFRKKLGY